MTAPARSWFVGAWKRRSITVPGAQPVEPCEAWWLQAGEVFVDVRVARPGMEHNGLPYSSTRVFAGRFDIVDGEARWHVVLDSDGVVPRTDRAAAAGLYIAPDDPLLMIEDAPGRFREEWVQCAAGGDVESLHGPHVFAVRIGDVSGVVLSTGEDVVGRIWSPEGSVTIGI